MLTKTKYSGRRPLVVGAAVVAAVLMALLPLAGCKNDSVAEPARYTVTFDKNSADATGEMAAQSFTAGAAQKLTANGFSRTGYAFAGWAESSGGPAKYTDGQEITVSASTTLYAKWAAAASVTTSGGTTTNYTTLDAALAAAMESVGSTLTLLQDQTRTSSVEVWSGSFTLDLNGHTIAVTGESDEIYGIWVAGYGNLTIQDSSTAKTGTVSVTVSSTSDSYVISRAIFVQAGTAVIRSGNFKAVHSGSAGMTIGVDVYSNTTACHIEGGSISAESATDSSYGIYNNRGTMTVKGCAVSATGSSGYGIANLGNGSLTVTGPLEVTGSTAAFQVGVDSSPLTIAAALSPQPPYKVHMYNPAVFAVPGAGVTLDANWFQAANASYEVVLQPDGKLALQAKTN